MASTYIFVITFTSCCMVSCFAAHSHSQERESDGALKSRDDVHKMEFDHEVILGSVKEAEEFDTLSPEESQRRLADLLPKIDQDSDGAINKEELLEWILNNLVKLSVEEAEERLKECDDNKDGMVTWKEYLRDSFGVDDDEDVHEEDTGDGGMLLHEEKVMWAAADTNGDGSLDPQEFQLFINPEEHESMFKYVVNSTFREKDKNEDGYIDFNEYLGDRAADRDPLLVEDERARFTSEYDKDKDGRLDPQEVQDWVIPNNVLIASEEVEHLFDSANEDHDAVLSYDEILKRYDLFVGSEATDYGEMLRRRDEL